MAHQARKRFGQNFLVDQSVIQRIVHFIHPLETDNLIEIGPGKGALTGDLLAHVKKIQVIELDRDLIPILTRNCANKGELNIIQADALKVELTQLTQTKARIIGNLPYNISTPLLFHLLDQAEWIVDMHFMLQKEVVDRICATPGNKKWGRLSVMLQAKTTVKMLFNVPPHAFNPAPKVQSAIVRLIPKETPAIQPQDWMVFAKIVRAAFSQRRKTIHNTLGLFFNDKQLQFAGVNPTDRAEQISLNQFVALVNLYQSHHLQ